MTGALGSDAVRLDPQDGTNCLSCGMTRRDCAAAEPGEVDVRCCDDCRHPGEVVALARAIALEMNPLVQVPYRSTHDTRRLRAVVERTSWAYAEAFYPEVRRMMTDLRRVLADHGCCDTPGGAS